MVPVEQIHKQSFFSMLSAYTNRHFPTHSSLGDYEVPWFNDHLFAHASQISYLQPWPRCPLVCQNYSMYQRNHKAAFPHANSSTCSPVAHSALQLLLCSAMASAESPNQKPQSFSLVPHLPHTVRHPNLQSQSIYDSRYTFSPPTSFYHHWTLFSQNLHISAVGSSSHTAGIHHSHCSPNGHPKRKYDRLTDLFKKNLTRDSGALKIKFKFLSMQYQALSELAFASFSSFTPLSLGNMLSHTELLMILGYIIIYGTSNLFISYFPSPQSSSLSPPSPFLTWITPYFSGLHKAFSDHLVKVVFSEPCTS